jgi:hypothetical protein
MVLQIGWISKIEDQEDTCNYIECHANAFDKHGISYDPLTSKIEPMSLVLFSWTLRYINIKRSNNGSVQAVVSEGRIYSKWRESNSGPKNCIGAVSNRTGRNTKTCDCHISL